MRIAVDGTRDTSATPTPGRVRDHLVARSVAAWLCVAAVLIAVVAISNPLSKGEYPGPSYDIGAPGLLHGWFQFDAGWYFGIVRNGYYLAAAQSPVAFFPAYPLAIRWAAPLFGHRIGLTAMTITFICGLASVALFASWCRDRLEWMSARWAVALLIVYPYSWYLVGAVYADALFLAATLGAFVALERGHPVLAGLLGAVATAGRPVAPAVVLGLAVLAAERRGALRTLSPQPPDGAGRIRTLAHRWELPSGLRYRELRPSDLAVLFSAAGFVAYAGYLWVRFGDPLAFSTVQKYWDQPSGPVTLIKAHLWGNALLHPISHGRYVAGCLLQGVLIVGALLLTPRVARRFGWGYGALVFVCTAMPIVGSKDFQGTGRYLLAAFPVFALGGEWLAERSPRARAWVLGGSGALLLVLTHLYARGFYVA